jgi:hypothetical protein
MNKTSETSDAYTKETAPVGSKFVSFKDPSVIGTVTEHWFDRGDGLTIKWTNGNVSKLYFEELKNPKVK